MQTRSPKYFPSTDDGRFVGWLLAGKREELYRQVFEIFSFTDLFDRFCGRSMIKLTVRVDNILDESGGWLVLPLSCSVGSKKKDVRFSFRPVDQHNHVSCWFMADLLDDGFDCSYLTMQYTLIPRNRDLFLDDRLLVSAMSRELLGAYHRLTIPRI